MLRFTSREVLVGHKRVELACLEPDGLSPDETELECDGKRLLLPGFVVQAIARATLQIMADEAHGLGADCNTWGVRAMGGYVKPVARSVYRFGHVIRTASGAPLSSAELEQAPAEMRLVNFGHTEGGKGEGRHVALQLPVHDLYAQQLGHDLPVALASSGELMSIYGCNAARAVSRMQDTLDGEIILHYERQQ